VVAEKLNLFPIGALNFYRSYPEDMDDPLQTFIARINAVGEALDETEKEVLMKELPTAFQKTSTLLLALAHDD
jgi:hypothetical protein